MGEVKLPGVQVRLKMVWKRFSRNVIGGSASARFHRPWAGSGLSPLSQAAIGAVRKAEQHIKLWDVVPRQDLLSDREENEAYLAASHELQQYLLYFTNGGEVKLKLNREAGVMVLQWVSISTGDWGGKTSITITDEISIRAPGEGGWLALIYTEK